MDKRVGVITLGVDDGVDDESDRTAFFQAPPTAGSRTNEAGPATPTSTLRDDGSVSLGRSG